MQRVVKSKTQSSENSDLYHKSFRNENSVDGKFHNGIVYLDCCLCYFMHKNINK